MSTKPRRRRNMLEKVVKPHQILPSTDEHPLMERLRQVLNQYQQQSAAHFALAIEVHQIERAHFNEEQPKAKLSTKVIDVLIQGNSTQGRISIPLTCRLTLPKRGSKAGSLQCTIITHTRRVQVLEQFLGSAFPVVDAPLPQDTLWHWWQNNGKLFGWLALPTESKEHIIEFCMHQPHTFGLYSQKRTSFDQRYQNNRKIRKPGPLEIVDQLGDWYQLLYVSHQVRAVTLRLCIIGGSSLTRSKGLCITASSLGSFTESLDRLGDYYQMTEPYSIPTSSAEKALSKYYSHFPRIYPELRQYATFRHGIQKISLGMDFLSFMDFFAVKSGRFQDLRKARGSTYHVLERLPSLNEIVIRLPLRPREGWNNSPRAGRPPLFHHQSPCPRVLHRVIYERVAEVLVSYERVTVRNFIDTNEEQRFLSARVEATKALRFTKVQLQELYADTSGGVELPEGLEREVSIPEKVKRKHGEVEYPEDTKSSFFPPVCHCDEPCALSLVLGASEY